MIKLTTTLGFILDHHEDLGVSLHQFGLGQHNTDARKAFKDCSEQHQIIGGSCDTPSLEDAAILKAPDGVSLQTTLAMERGDHTRLRLVLLTLFGPDHLTELAMKEINA